MSSEHAGGGDLSDHLEGRAKEVAGSVLDDEKRAGCDSTSGS